MKKIISYISIVLVSLVIFSGCVTQLEIGIDMNSKWANIPMTEDFKYFAPGKEFELTPGLIVKTESAEAFESVSVLDPDNPYDEIYSKKGRFLILKVSAWKNKEIIEQFPLLMSINVLGWTDEILDDRMLIKKIESVLGIPFLRPEIVTRDKQEFFICFPTEGASLGWIIHIYKEINGELFLDKRIDTGI
jgi:hypothetical protein